MADNSNSTVYIGNMDDRVSESVLYDILIQAGRVVDLHIPRDKETDKPKGYAFAVYESEEIAEYAVKLFSGPVTLYKRTLRFGMQGSIADDLYSDILSSSTVEDVGSIAFQVNHETHVSKSDPSDLWCDDGSSCEGSIEKSTLSSDMDMDREWRRRRNQFRTIGYRDGLIAGKETSAQGGFNIGFRESVLIGYDWGLVRGITSAMAFLPDKLREKLVETEETRTKFQLLHKSMHSLSTTDALKLFYEGQKRRSGNQDENGEPCSNIADLNHQNPDVSFFQNYYREVQSLISEAHLDEAHFLLGRNDCSHSRHMIYSLVSCIFDALHDALKLNGVQVFLRCDPFRNALNDYHVISSPDHEKFEDLRSKACNLLGPQCVLSCAKEHRSLPNQGFTCCLAMDGVNILVSGFEKDEKGRSRQ